MPPTATIRQNGHALRAFREIRGLSIVELAEEARVTAASLRNWELEHRALPKIKAQRLCAALSIRVDAITRDAVASQHLGELTAS